MFQRDDTASNVDTNCIQAFVETSLDKDVNGYTEAYKYQTQHTYVP